jgi:hypothetical protein
VKNNDLAKSAATMKKAAVEALTVGLSRTEAFLCELLVVGGRALRGSLFSVLQCLG